MRVKAITLDDLISEYGISGVDFIKLEAEGWEPEVLLGARFSLKICKRIAVDAGPERGSSNTVVEVADILKEAGYAFTNNNYIINGIRK
jgi:hypothetical protein